MRPDFYDRFIKYTIPPLYKRRVDIFYYMLQFAPNILPKLRAWEIMALLAHPWPGNVRELAAVSMDMERAHFDIPKIMGKEFANAQNIQRGLPSLLFARKEHTELKEDDIRERYRSMQRADIDVRLLEKLLNRYDLGFDTRNEKTPWAEKDFSTSLSTLENDKKRDELLGTITYRDDIFPRIREGLKFYRNLFLRLEVGPDSLLSVRSSEGRDLMSSSPIGYIKKPTDRHDALVKSILEYCLKRQIDPQLRCASLIGMGHKDYAEWVGKVIDKPVHEPEEDRAIELQNSSAISHKPDLTAYKNEDEMIQAWYWAWARKFNGRYREMFTVLGINEKTGYRRLRQYGIKSQ